jgi:hypothetical protein
LNHLLHSTDLFECYCWQNYTTISNTDLYLSYFNLSYLFPGHNDSVQWGLTVAYSILISIRYKIKQIFPLCNPFLQFPARWYGGLRCFGKHMSYYTALKSNLNANSRALEQTWNENDTQLSIITFVQLLDRELPNWKVDKNCSLS